MGPAVFCGMLGVTVFVFFLTPVFFVVLLRFGRKPAPAPASRPQHGGDTLLEDGAAPAHS
jgi:hypothetical protein